MFFINKIEVERVNQEKRLVDSVPLCDSQDSHILWNTFQYCWFFSTLRFCLQLQEANVAVLRQVQESHKNVEMMNRRMAELKNEVAQKNSLYVSVSA